MTDLTMTLAPFTGMGLLARAERKSAAPISILGVPFDHVTMRQAIAAIEDMIASGEPHYLATANVDFLVQALEDQELRRILLHADMVLCDGTPLVWVSRWLGNPLPERVAGADLAPELLSVAADKGYRIFFLGGKPDVAARAVERLKTRHPEIKIAGSYSPPFAPLEKMDHEEIRERIRAARPDILLVSFGCPKAEKWISLNYQSIEVPVSMGVGATIDFLAGEVKRAPAWMQRAGLEWVFRFLQEPGRLGPRYARDLRRFGFAIARQMRVLRSECAQDHANDSLTATFSLQVVRIMAPQHLHRGVLMRDLPQRFYVHAQDCVIDLSRTQSVDGTALGWLARLHRNQRTAGRKLVLLAPGKVVRRALGVAGLDALLSIADSEADAAQFIANSQ